jgi:hypothetical protein
MFEVHPDTGFVRIRFLLSAWRRELSVISSAWRGPDVCRRRRCPPIVVGWRTDEEGRHQ